MSTACLQDDTAPTAALERMLTDHPLRLLQFAAKQDFTVENIIFLLHVLRWRQAWNTVPRAPGTGELTGAAREQLFRMATDIYVADFDHHMADFPVNVERTIRSSLQKMLNNTGAGRTIEEVASRTRLLAGMVSSTEEIWDPWGNRRQQPMVELESPDLAFPYGDGIKFELPHFDLEQADVPRNLHLGIFDAAEESIKHLVLISTWRRFVMHEGQGDLFDHTLELNKV